MFRRARFGAIAILLPATALPGWANDAPDPQGRGDTVYVFGVHEDYTADRTRAGTRTDTALADIPQAITIITGDLIEDQAMRSFADVVRYVPGVSIGQGEGHRDAPSLRGQSTTADFFVDGLRDDVQYFRDFYNVARIEVLKGSNALIFGRGGGGGVINRVIKKADGEQGGATTLEAGMFDFYRGSLDVGGGHGGTAGRLNLVYESSGSFRDHVEVEKFGFNPTASVFLSPDTTLRVSHEYFSDERTVDRGVPSVAATAAPLERDREQFFGDPDLNVSEFDVNLSTATLDHSFSDALSLRAAIQYASYDKFYRNVFPASQVAASGALNFAAYESATDRDNLFAQTDLIWETTTGPVSHKLLFALEYGDQDTRNLRSEAQFPTVGGGERLPVSVTASEVRLVPGVDIVFGRRSQDNTVQATILSALVQDQIGLTDRLDLVVGLRFDSFDLSFDNGLGADFSRKDEFASPRLGLVFRPVDELSIYASYAQSRLPQSGDQFSSLDATTAALEPEQFDTYEIGAKWAPRPGFELAAAVYRLDRTNTRANDPLRGITVLSGEQRSEGFELSVAGAVTPKWDIVAAYAYTDARITQATTSAPAGRVSPLAPEQEASIWNRYQFAERFAAGLGVIHVGEQFTTLSNAVVLPSFTRVDAALFYDLSDRVGVQVNFENLTDETYFPTAHNDVNISPGAPFTVRGGLRLRF
ncbi:TonB-dependent siderophore receptor [bacterium]|nr:TonB-dependent siderophore receptor [bacterium]